MTEIIATHDNAIAWTIIREASNFNVNYDKMMRVNYEFNEQNLVFSYNYRI